MKLFAREKKVRLWNVALISALEKKGILDFQDFLNEVDRLEEEVEKEKKRKRRS